MLRFLRPVTFAILFLAISSVAKAQWLVYELRFRPEAGSVNFSFYTGAYVVAPMKGGPASIVFTTEEGGHFYAVSQNSLRYYMAAGPAGKQAVLSAFTINGTAQAFYSAAGALTTPMSYVENGVSRSTSVAAEIAGLLLASDDESYQSPAADGSLGMIGRATISGTLRPDLTQIANQSAVTMGDAVGSITALLEKYGYTPDVDEPAPDATASPAQTTQTTRTDEGTSDVSALFGAQERQPAIQTVEEAVAAEFIQPSLLPPLGEEGN